MYDREKAIKAQKKFCEVNDLPNFSPRDGHCYRCGNNIFAEEPRNPDLERPYDKRPHGYTVEHASEDLITGCPFCHISYCD